MRLTKEQRVSKFVQLIYKIFIFRIFCTSTFLWSALKDQVCNLRPKTIPKLKNAISDKFFEIVIEMCQKVCKSVAGRVQNCMENEGKQFEYLKQMTKL